MSSSNSSKREKTWRDCPRMKPRYSVFDPSKHSHDDRRGAPIWLQVIKSIAPEDRNRVFRPKNYQPELKQLRTFDQQTKIKLNSIISQPVLLENKLAEIAALFPRSSDMRVSGLGKIQGKDQYERIRAILLYINSVESEYVRFLLMEPFLKLIPRRSSEPGIQAELKFLDMVFSLDPNQRKETIRKLYSRHNLQAMIERGKELCEHMFLHFVDTRPVTQKQRKRGYNDKGSTSLQSEKERKKCMNEIDNSFEERKQRVLEKQLELFERNLDKLLQIDTAKNRRVIKRIIQDRDEELEEINNDYIQSIKDLKGEILEE